jgi:hypothetical protein
MSETAGKTKLVFADYANYDEWDTRPPIVPSYRPICLPREWVGHIAIALSTYLNHSRERTQPNPCTCPPDLEADYLSQALPHPGTEKASKCLSSLLLSESIRSILGLIPIGGYWRGP